MSSLIQSLMLEYRQGSLIRADQRPFELENLYVSHVTDCNRRIWECLDVSVNVPATATNRIWVYRI